MSEESVPVRPPASGLQKARWFLGGLLLGGIPVLAYFSMSLWMTHTPLAQVGRLELGVAIALPLLLGLLAARYRGRALEVIGSMLESVNWPF